MIGHYASLSSSVICLILAVKKILALKMGIIIQNGVDLKGCTF
jgi:hypothetical protein